MKTKREIEQAKKTEDAALSDQNAKTFQPCKNTIQIPDTSPQEINLKSYAKSLNNPRNTWTTEKQGSSCSESSTESDTDNKPLMIGKLIHRRRLDKNLTIKEVAKACGVSEGTVSRWEHGLICNMRRGNITILSQVLDIPTWQLLGQDRQSDPALARPVFFETPVLNCLNRSVPVSISNHEVIDIEYLSANKFSEPASAYFGFRVMDNSLAPEILPGDNLICHIQETANNYSYVIISLDEKDAICRKIYAYKNTVLLLAPNDDPIILNSLEIKKRHPKIFGVVVEIRRNCHQN